MVDGREWETEMAVVVGADECAGAILPAEPASDRGPPLPKLPWPNYAEMCLQSLLGTSVVCGITFYCVNSVLLVEDGWARRAVLLEAVVALTCLVGILFGDPGVVRRTPTSTSPVPGQVDVYLRGDEGRRPRANLTDDEGFSYCVRCFVWRRGRDGRRLRELGDCGDSFGRVNCAPHHCSTCQRCVLYFDHHCGVFGRCIAGRGFGGNMGYFKVIIVMGVLGPVSAILANPNAMKSLPN